MEGKMEEFITIKEDIQVEITEKKSRFIANLFYVENIAQAENIIKETRKKYYDARHNCIAYRIMDDGKLIERSNDDGEPSGTAGAPMLNILQKNELVNVLIIVTRYFGGVLLGTGGLVRAYSSSLVKAIDNSIKVKKCLGEELEIIVDYNNFDKFKYYCKNNDINIVNTEYEDNIICIIEVSNIKKDKLIDDFNNKKIILKNIKDKSIKFITKSI